MTGPLTGIIILELAGIGPGPFAGMMLADLGAKVVRIDRPGGNPSAAEGHNVLFRNRRSVVLDLKHSAGVDTLLRLCAKADALYEGFRPGTVERLGIGPNECLAVNPSLVYGRITGWGQDGPLATAAGHDINYIALAGALHAIGGPDHDGPVIPLNLVGDFGGGGMLLAYGLVCGLLQAKMTGLGQVVDAAMLDGIAAQMAMFNGLRGQGLFGTQRGTHQLDGGAHYYNVYETADGEWIALGPIEPQFYDEFCDLLGLDDQVRNGQHDTARWPEFRGRVAAVVGGRTAQEWEDRLSGTDACFARVLDLDEAAHHPHNRARGTFTTVNGVFQHAPAPRFSATASCEPEPEPALGTDTIDVLKENDFTMQEIEDLLTQQVIATAG